MGRPGDDDPMKAGELGRGEVVVGDAPPDPEISAVGAGVDRPHRDDEAQPVGGRDLPSSPGLRQRDAGLGLDQPGVGPGEGVGPQIILLDPAQAVTAQGGVVLPDQGLQPDVAGLRQQDRAHAQGQVLHSRPRLAQMRELVRKASPRVYLQQQFRQIHPRHHRVGLVPEMGVGRRLFQPVQARQGEDVFPGVGLDPDGGVAGQIGGGAPVGLVQKGA